MDGLCFYVCFFRVFIRRATIMDPVFRNKGEKEARKNSELALRSGVTNKRENT